MGELQATLRANNKSWVEQFLHHLVDDQGYLDKEGEIELTCADLEIHLKSLIERRGWQHAKSERALTTKLSLLKLTWTGIRGGGEEHRVWRDGKNQSLWYFNLDDLRPKFGIDIERDRLRRRLAEECYQLENKISDSAIRFLQSSLGLSGSQKDVVRKVLHKEIEAIKCDQHALQKRPTRPGEADEFDPEAEYERVMGAPVSEVDAMSATIGPAEEQTPS